MAQRSRQGFKKSKENKFPGGTKSFIAVLAVIAAALIGYFIGGDFTTSPTVNTPDDAQSETSGTAQSSQTAQVHFINVGQGDCELIVADDGTTMLIDAGESEYGATVVDYIKSLGITRLDYVVGTHPHSDHIGGLKDFLLSDLDVGVVITPSIPDEYTPTTKSYERFIDAVAQKGCEVSDVTDESFDMGSGRITVIDTEYSSDNYNNYSAVILFEFGENSFLFTGDIEKTIEKQLVENDAPIDVDVLKVAHHGSSTSSCFDFLDAVTPEYCVIECGDSSYNHPNPDTVTRLKAYTQNIYRTDNQGNIVFTCTADGLSITCEKGEEDEAA